MGSERRKMIVAESASVVEATLRCFDDNPKDDDDRTSVGIYRFAKSAGETVCGKPVDLHDVMNGLFELRRMGRVVPIHIGNRTVYRLRAKEAEIPVDSEADPSRAELSGVPLRGLDLLLTTAKDLDSAVTHDGTHWRLRGMLDADPEALAHRVVRVFKTRRGGAL